MKSSKNVVLSAAKIVNKKAMKSARLRIQIVADRFFYCDFDQSIEIGLDEPSEKELKYDSMAELELYAAEHESTATIPRVGSDFSAAELTKALSWLSLAVDDRATRYALSGVCWDGDFLVATDGRRLQFYRIGECIVENQNAAYLSFNIIPTRAIQAVCLLAKLFKDDILSVRFSGDSFIVHGDCWRFSTRVVEGRFPKWRDIVKDGDGLARLDLVNVHELRTNAQHAIKTARLQDEIAKQTLSKKELKTFDRTIPRVKIVGDNFNAEYILDCLEIIDSGMIEAKRRSGDSALFLGDSVLMPMK
jgi:DNA polymerase III sliding clamp (beta) subunit (PCNA family)